VKEGVGAVFKVGKSSLTASCNEIKIVVELVLKNGQFGTNYLT
jgi:hypothetical protein